MILTIIFENYKTQSRSLFEGILDAV